MAAAQISKPKSRRLMEVLPLYAIISSALTISVCGKAQRFQEPNLVFSLIHPTTNWRVCDRRAFRRRNLVFPPLNQPRWDYKPPLFWTKSAVGPGLGRLSFCSRLFEYLGEQTFCQP
jgi:hypothetical protein